MCDMVCGVVCVSVVCGMCVNYVLYMCCGAFACAVYAVCVWCGGSGVGVCVSVVCGCACLCIASDMDSPLGIVFWPCCVEQSQVGTSFS